MGGSERLGEALPTKGHGLSRLPKYIKVVEEIARIEYHLTPERSINRTEKVRSQDLAKCLYFMIFLLYELACAQRS